MKQLTAKKWLLPAAAIFTILALAIFTTFPMQASAGIRTSSSSSSSSSSSNTNNTGVVAGDGTAFWMAVHYEMFFTTAKTVNADADMQEFDYVPAYILDLLHENPGTTLTIKYKGESYSLNSANLTKNGIGYGHNYLFTTLYTMGL